MLRVLPNAVTHRAALYVQAGAFGAASSLIEEADAITQATEMAPLRYAKFMLAAWRGHEDDTVAMIEAGRISATAGGEGLGLSVSDWIMAVLFNGLARYQDAHAAAERACADDVVANSAWALAELIEAGVRSGETDTTSAALDRLSERTQASGTDWALGILARSRALLSEGDGADALYREAIERLERTRIRVELARRSALRRVAAPRAAPGRCARAVARRARDVLHHGCRRVRRARSTSSCWRQARPSASARSRRATSSPRRRRRSPGWRVTGARTPRSGRSCTSARARSSGT